MDFSEILKNPMIAQFLLGAGSGMMQNPTSMGNALAGGIQGGGNAALDLLKQQQALAAEQQMYDKHAAAQMQQQKDMFNFKQDAERTDAERNAIGSMKYLVGNKTLDEDTARGLDATTLNNLAAQIMRQHSDPNNDINWGEPEMKDLGSGRGIAIQRNIKDPSKVKTHGGVVTSYNYGDAPTVSKVGDKEFVLTGKGWKQTNQPKESAYTKKSAEVAAKEDATLPDQLVNMESSLSLLNDGMHILGRTVNNNGDVSFKYEAGGAKPLSPSTWTHPIGGKDSNVVAQFIGQEANNDPNLVKLRQLQNNVNLRGAVEWLKGQGSVTDSERGILDKATSLNPENMDSATLFDIMSKTQSIIEKHRNLLKGKMDLHREQYGTQYPSSGQSNTPAPTQTEQPDADGYIYRRGPNGQMLRKKVQ